MNDRLRSRPRLDALEARDVPAVVALNDTYAVGVGRVLTVQAEDGVLTNDFSTTGSGDILSATQTTPPRYVGSNRPLPADSLTFFQNGSFQFIAPSNVPAGVSQVQFSYTANNLTTPTDTPATAVVTVNFQSNQQEYIAAGSGVGTPPQVQVYRVGTGQLVFSLAPYEATFTGGVRVAVGDLNDDGVDDIATAPGVGGGGRVVVFDGNSGAPIYDNGDVFNDPNFRGGASVAIGDFEGDGVNDLIVGAGEQGGPRVLVIDGTTFGPNAGAATFILADFFAYESTFRNGVRVAAGDVLGVGRDFVVTAPGTGGGPVVKTFDGIQVLTDGVALPVLSFFAGDANGRTGLYVAAGDLSGTGQADVIVGTGAGPAVVTEYDGATGGLLRQFTVPFEETPAGGGGLAGSDAFAFSTPAVGSLINPTTFPNSLIQTGTFTGGVFTGNGTGGVTVGAVDYDGDGLADAITGPGPGSPPRVRIFNTLDNSQIDNFLAFPVTFLGGVNVGG